MTCKDCLHYDVCRNNTETTAYYLFSPHTGKYFDEHNGCIHFTPKSEWIHIPCKIGDVVWYIDEIWKWDMNTDQTTSCKQVISGERVIEAQVRSISISCNAKGEWIKKVRLCEMKNGKTIDNQDNIEFDCFGVLVFTTKEDAEKALMKRNGG